MQQDKRNHMALGFFLSFLGVFCTPLVALGFLFGVAKEVRDLMGYGTPEWLDLWATWLGSLIATILVIYLKDI